MTPRRWAAACTALLLFGVVVAVAGTPGAPDGDPRATHETVAPATVVRADAAVAPADSDRETTARSSRRRTSSGDDARRVLDRGAVAAQLAVSLALLGALVATRRPTDTEARLPGGRRDRAPPLLAAP
jgi:hypothetical protein